VAHDKLTRRLGAVLGIGFIVFGLVESGIALAGQDNIVFFWFPALCGGGVLILLGLFKVLDPGWASIGLVTVGAFAGALATIWTVIVPLLAVALVVLVVGRSSRPATAAP